MSTTAACAALANASATEWRRRAGTASPPSGFVSHTEVVLEGSFGGAVHDGDDTYFGCRANFHESGSVGFMLSERWDVMATVDHMSNADLCDANRGLTNVGFRIGRRW